MIAQHLSETLGLSNCLTVFHDDLLERGWEESPNTLPLKRREKWRVANGDRAKAGSQKILEDFMGALHMSIRSRILMAEAQGPRTFCTQSY